MEVSIRPAPLSHKVPGHKSVSGLRPIAGDHWQQLPEEQEEEANPRMAGGAAWAVPGPTDEGAIVSVEISWLKGFCGQGG
eukprot:1157705-Pelagomonas_calceolata.AAC.7